MGRHPAGPGTLSGGLHRADRMRWDAIPGERPDREPDTLTATAVVEQVSCAGSCDGSIVVSPQGGTGSLHLQLDTRSSQRRQQQGSLQPLPRHLVGERDRCQWL